MVWIITALKTVLIAGLSTLPYWKIIVGVVIAFVGGLAVGTIIDSMIPEMWKENYIIDPMEKAYNWATHLNKSNSYSQEEMQNRLEKMKQQKQK